MSSYETLRALSESLRFGKRAVVERVIIELIQEHINILEKYGISFDDAWATWKTKAEHKHYY